METISFEIELPVQECVQALLEIDARFTDGELGKLRTHDVICSELIVMRGLASMITRRGELEPVTDKPKAFWYMTQPRQRGLRPDWVWVWQVHLTPIDTGTLIEVIPAEDLTHNLQGFYRRFTRLVKDWATRLQQEQTGDELLRDALDLSETPTDTADLTEAEKEIAILLAAGYSKADIAKLRVRGWSTIQTQCEKIAEKWGLDTTKISKLQDEARTRGYGGG